LGRHKDHTALRLEKMERGVGGGERAVCGNCPMWPFKTGRVGKKKKKGKEAW